MISDHIKYLKSIVEDSLQRSNGSTPFKERFFEVYPAPSTILESVPCAALRFIDGNGEEDGTLDRIENTSAGNVHVRKLTATDTTYQVDFYSKDIYDFIASGDEDDLLTRFIALVSEKYRIKDNRGNAIEVNIGAYGLIDDESIIVDGIYKAYCRVSFSDGIYKSKGTVTMPDADNIIIEVNND